MEDAKQQLVDKLKTSNNVLVTVGRNPSVDQLSALLGLTLFLNKQGKHAAAVFSGEVPSTLEFLQPSETIEKNTDSLRDFIIALDKSKADKLRYKVEDNVVRIFITPYKTSITQDDFEFSQGDFNVDLVVALGVQQQEDLDEAITTHGRILHDATVASINTTAEGGIGVINWHQPQASSLSELVTQLVQSLAGDLLDEQISTALLTGIVAETDRFSNDKTSSQTMSVSAALMAAGANQQLVASKLQEPVEPLENTGDTPTNEPADDDQDKHDGTLEIDHEQEDDKADEGPAFELPTPDENSADEPDEVEAPAPAAVPEPPPVIAEAEEPTSTLSAGPKLVTEPPTLGGTLTANSTVQGLEPSTDPFSMPSSEPPKLFDHKSDPLALASEQPAPPPEPATPEPTFPTSPASDFTTIQPPVGVPPADDPTQPPAGPPPTDQPAADQPPKGPYSTLAELEESVDSPHTETAGLDAARDEVSRALTQATAAGNTAPEPIQALNAQPLGNDLRPADNQVTATPPAQVNDPTAPPPVPPPIPFQFGNPPQQQ